MPAKGKIPINMNISPELLARIDKFRFKREFATRTETIEFMAEFTLKLNPEKPSKEKS